MKKDYKNCSSNYRVRDRVLLYTIAISFLGLVALGYQIELGKLFNIARAEVSVPKTDNTPMRDWVINEVRMAGIDEYKAWAIINCESGWNPEATNINKDKSIDRGLFQISNTHHGEVSSSCAFNPKCATKEFIRIQKRYGWNEWVCASILHIK